MKLPRLPRFTRTTANIARRAPRLTFEPLEDRALPAPFVAGNLALLRVNENDTNAPASIIEIDEATAGQTLDAVQRIDVPTGGLGSIRLSGSATSTGYVSRTDDRSQWVFNGVNTTDTTANVSTLNPRAVVTIGANGATPTIATTYTGASGQQTRSATSLDNSTWFISDQNGIYTNGSTAASPVANTRGIKSFGGTVYVGMQSTITTNIQVSTVSAPTGGTITGLPGLTNQSQFQDFYLIQSGDNGTTYDVLYITRNTSTTAGQIDKYSLVAGTWVSNGFYTTTFGGYGIAASDLATGAQLYVTTGNGATTANSVIRLTDVGGYNSTIDITTASNVTLYFYCVSRLDRP